MIQLIFGNKGSGKTKKLIEMINKSVEDAKGNIVCVEKGIKLTFDISHKARLIHADDFRIMNSDSFYGFISGIISENYDISEIYVDGILKMVGRDYTEVGFLLEKLDALSNKFNVKLIITVSDDIENLPAEITRYNH